MPDDAKDDVRTVLRDIWSATGQTTDQLEETLGRGGSGKVCKNMARIGFGGMAQRGDGDTNTPVDEDVRAAWRARLARDGKLDPAAESIGATLRRKPRA